MGHKQVKSQILQLRKGIFDNLKARAYDLEKHSDELASYLSEQTELSNRKFALVSLEEIKQHVLNSQIIYIGDFHTFDQNIRNVLRVIKFAVEGGKKCKIALEMVHHQFQMFVDAYVEKHITDLEFLESINYHDSWRFPWTHYKQIFDLAREHGIEVVAINTTGGLAKRDSYAAERIEKIQLKDPETKLIILYGELHITPQKIPALVKQKMPKIKHIIIHQNLDNVYWNLIDQGQDEGIVSFNNQEFCIISAPPWIKYESMIYWYENLCDDPDFDIHNYIIENGKKTFSDDTKESFYQLSCEIIKSLKISLSEEAIEDFNLYDHSQLDFIEEFLDVSTHAPAFKIYEHLIKNSFSFKVPGTNKYYCSSYSMNRIAYLVGVHIFHLIHGKKITHNSVTFIKNKESFFTISVLEATCAYFFSKILNPHRKCEMYLDMNAKHLDNQAIYTKALAFIERNDIIFKEVEIVELYEVALLLGHMLGEYLYLDINQKNSDNNLNFLIKHINITLNDLIKLKDQLLKNFDYKLHAKKYF